MGKDVQAAYEQALKEEPRYAGIVPVGLAWNRAIDTGVADDNPYDDIDASKIDLWAYDHYHGSFRLLPGSADGFRQDHRPGPAGAGGQGPGRRRDRHLAGAIQGADAGGA